MALVKREPIDDGIGEPSGSDVFDAPYFTNWIPVGDRFGDDVDGKRH